MGKQQDNKAHRTSSTCSLVAGLLVFGAVVLGILVEVRALWREGVSFFMRDAGMRLAFGACLAILCAAPYLLIAKASRKGGPSMLYSAAAVLMLAFQIWFMAQTLLFARSSTAAIGVLFMPLYLLVPAGTVWLAASLAREFRRRRASK